MRPIVLLILAITFSTARAEPVVQVTITGTFDSRTSSVEHPYPDGVGPGTSYSAVLRYDTALASPNLTPDIPQFASDLGDWGTEFVVSCAGRTWTLDGEDALPFTSRVFQFIFPGSSYTLTASNPSEATVFPYTAGAVDKMRLSIGSEVLWPDPDTILQEHLSSAGQINLAGADRSFSFSSEDADGRGWEFRDSNPSVQLEVLYGVVATEDETVSALKRRY